MTVYVFLGPSLPLDEARAELDAVYLPPVAQGDLYRVALRRPRAIAVIDGYFERVPAVWHKEILWAMAQGVHVYGAASMGALRAAELASFGMRGVGWIFEAFASGALTDDDEVAVSHSAAEHGYRPLSTAMVNIRRTLAAAAVDGAVSEASRDVLLELAKRLFYPERVYARLLREGAAAGVPARELAALEAWLPGGQLDQKREDARALLRLVGEELAAGLEPKRVRYTLEHTEWWDYVQRNAGALTIASGRGESLELEALLEELRLRPDVFASLREAALARELACASAGAAGERIGARELEAIAGERCRALGLESSAALEAWLAHNHLDFAGFMRLMEEHALLQRTRHRLHRRVIERLPDELRLTDAYAVTLARALDKRRRLESHGQLHPGLEDIDLTLEELLDGYFGGLGVARPEDHEALEEFAAAAGFDDGDALVRALLRERCYQRLTEEEA